MNKKDTNNYLKRAIDEYGSRILQFVDFQIQNIEAAKDIVQETFIVFFENHGKVAMEKTESYLFAVARNKIKDHFKMKKNFVGINHSHRSDTSYLSTMESKDVIKLALSNLTKLDRDLITLRDVMGYNYEQVAKILNLSISQVKVYLFRARKKFKGHIIKLEVIYESK